MNSDLFWTLFALGFGVAHGGALIAQGARVSHVLGLGIMALIFGSSLTIWWPRPEGKK